MFGGAATRQDIGAEYSPIAGRIQEPLSQGCAAPHAAQPRAKAQGLCHQHRIRDHNSRDDDSEHRHRTLAQGILLGTDDG